MTLSGLSGSIQISWLYQDYQEYHTSRHPEIWMWSFKIYFGFTADSPQVILNYTALQNCINISILDERIAFQCDYTKHIKYSPFYVNWGLMGAFLVPTFWASWLCVRGTLPARAFTWHVTQPAMCVGPLLTMLNTPGSWFNKLTLERIWWTKIIG